MFDFTDKVVLITGSGRGVGAGIARALAKQGATLAINDFFAERADEMVAELQADGHPAVSVPFDVTDMASVSAGIAKIEAAFSSVDVLINNVGTLPHGMYPTPFVESPPELWEQHIDNNLYGTLNCTRCVIEGMKAKGWGRIIAISSDAGRVGHFGSVVYGAAKAGMEGAMRSLAIEHGRHGITANSIVLGLINTVPEEFSKGSEKHYATKRIGTPEDVAAASVYLASEEASWVTGHSLVVNGGYMG